MNTFFSRKGACIAGLLGLAIAAQAQTFQYSNGNLLIGVRSTSGGTYDLVVNAGPVSAFTNLTTGTKVTITSLSGSLLNSAFNDTNNLSWSAFACFDDSYPDAAQRKTLFMTRPRADLNTQSDPWGRYTATSQGGVVGKLNSVGAGAYNQGLALAAGPNNTAMAIIESESANVSPVYSYNSMLGAGLNWGGTFQGNPEQSTPASFTTDGQPVRSDFYWIQPGGSASSHPAATYLGYFDFNTNGVLTYTAGPSPSGVSTPQIVNVTRAGSFSTVYFTTGSSGTYTLLGTSDVTLPRASWSTLGSVSGNSSTQSLSETTTATFRYYTISAQ